MIIENRLEPGTHVTRIGARPDARTRGVVDVGLHLGTASAPVDLPERQPPDDVADAARQQDPCHERGLGRERPTAWSLQDIRD